MKTQTDRGMTYSQLTKALRIVAHDQDAIRDILAKDAGQGRGNWGHKGRPGMRGGSSKMDGGSSAQEKTKSAKVRASIPAQNVTSVSSSHINQESFGSDLPSNWQDIAQRANQRIESQAKRYDYDGNESEDGQYVDRDDVDRIFEQETSRDTQQPSSSRKQTYTDYGRVNTQIAKAAEQRAQDLFDKVMSEVDKQHSGSRKISEAIAQKYAEEQAEAINRDWNDDETVGISMLYSQIDKYDPDGKYEVVDDLWDEIGESEQRKLINSARKNPQQGFKDLASFVDEFDRTPVKVDQRQIDKTREQLQPYFKQQAELEKADRQYDYRTGK